MAHTSASKSFTLALGLMLFALFFGAGNLIYPPLLGQQAGVNLNLAMTGFLLTGVGLPLLSILAIGYSGTRDVQELASRVTPAFGILYSVALYIAIGPMLAMPRTATVSFEIGILPFLGEGEHPIALFIFSAIFFACSYWLSGAPGKLTDRIGKVLTPLLLLCILVLIVVSVINPLGDFQAATGKFIETPISKGFTEGYGTMDALAALAFAILVIDSIKSEGFTESKQITSLTIKAGILAAVCLIIVYYFVARIGAGSVNIMPTADNGAKILAYVTNHYFSTIGNVLLAAIVLLACLTTVIGLISSCANYFHRLIPNISYQKWNIIFTLVSFAFANKGLASILSLSVPILVFLYPLTMVLVSLVFLDKLFSGSRIVYICSIATTLIFATLDTYNAAFGLSEQTIAFLSQNLPLYNLGLGWVIPAITGFAIGLIIKMLKRS